MKWGSTFATQSSTGVTSTLLGGYQEVLSATLLHNLDQDKGGGGTQFLTIRSLNDIRLGLVSGTFWLRKAASASALVVSAPTWGSADGMGPSCLRVLPVTPPLARALDVGR
jgi:hypothetical protein